MLSFKTNAAIKNIAAKECKIRAQKHQFPFCYHQAINEFSPKVTYTTCKVRRERWWYKVEGECNDVWDILVV